MQTHPQRSWEQQETFQDIMAEQLEHAPWLGLSIMLHALVIAVLFTIKLDPKLVEEQIALIAEPQQITEEFIEEQPEEIPEEVVEDDPDPVLQDATLDEEKVAEDPNDDLRPLEDPTLVDSALDRDITNDIVGIGGGAGPTGLGNGRLNRDGPGGRPGHTTIVAIDRGLEWLAKHQDADGKWSGSEFMANCPHDDQCGGAGNPVHDVGVTGLALLAFLGDGSTLRGGKYKDVVKKGVRWLRRQQDDEGLIGEATGHGYIYNHAIAALAMVEACGLSQSTILKRNAQLAVNYIQKARNPYKVWRYYPQDGQNDTSVTGWMVFALKSAKEFELRVDQDSLKFAEAWFEEVTDPSTGQAGYTKRGEPSSRKAGLEDKFPASKTESMTAVGALCRIFLGQTPKEHPVLMSAADTMLRKPPVWNEADGSIDLYYWYYGTYAMFQIGGKHWQRWKRSLSDALLKTQHTEGHLCGSWDPISVWGEDGGRVYSTAIGVLCLEVYYRYTRLLR